MRPAGGAVRSPSAGRTVPSPADLLTDPAEGKRWSRALAVVLGIHAVPALVAAYWLGPTIMAPPPEPPVFIDLAPIPEPPAAPQAQPDPQPPQPQPVTRQVERQRIETPPVAEAAVALPVRPPEPPAQPRPAPPEPAPPPPARPAPRAAGGQANWQGMVLAHLDRHKRYPRSAQMRRQQGVPWIRIVIDRNGRVLSSNLERSSGHSLLDGEAAALPKRAQPLPKPPADIAGDTIELVVPVEFFLR